MIQGYYYFFAPVSFDVMLICNFLQKVSKLPCKVESKQFFLKIDPHTTWYSYSCALPSYTVPGSVSWLTASSASGFNYKSLASVLGSSSVRSLTLWGMPHHEDTQAIYGGAFCSETEVSDQQWETEACQQPCERVWKWILPQPILSRL